MIAGSAKALMSRFLWPVDCGIARGPSAPPDRPRAHDRQGIAQKFSRSRPGLGPHALGTRTSASGSGPATRLFGDLLDLLFPLSLRLFLVLFGLLFLTLVLVLLSLVAHGGPPFAIGDHLLTTGPRLPRRFYPVAVEDSGTQTFVR